MKYNYFEPNQSSSGYNSELTDWPQYTLVHNQSTQFTSSSSAHNYAMRPALQLTNEIQPSQTTQGTQQGDSYNSIHHMDRPIEIPLIRESSSNIYEPKVIEKPRRKFKRCDCSNCLNGHNRVGINGKRQHVCDVPGCMKVYTKSSHLMAHRRQHNDDRPYRCQYCEKAFTRSDQLQRHQKIHTGEKNFSCPLCEKKFMRSDHLKKHIKIHDNQKEKNDVKQAVMAENSSAETKILGVMNQAEIAIVTQSLIQEFDFRNTDDYQTEFQELNLSHLDKPLNSPTLQESLDEQFDFQNTNVYQKEFQELNSPHLEKQLNSPRLQELIDEFPEIVNSAVLIPASEIRRYF